MKKEREYHILNQADRVVLEECGGTKGEMKSFHVAQEGKPLPPDRPIYRVEPSSPGHVKLREIRLHDGPVQVATDEYRT
ncbi:MAG: hypothetical protein ACRD2R_02900, partial [Terriglobales bacterium]